MSYVSDPANFAAAVTPSNSTVLSPTRGLYVGTSGDIVVQMYGNGASITFTNVPVGIFPIRVTKVLLGTSAGNIIALW